jgi:peptide/nickel transport system permease protein
MIEYIVRRVLLMIPTLFVISVIVFTVIQLPPGDFLTTYAINLEQSGEPVAMEVLEALRVRYGLDKPMPVQYYKWISGIVLRGDFGQSYFHWRPVSDLIWERLGLTATIAFITIVFTWIIAIPIGIYSATHQYKFSDYAFTLLGYIGLSIPAFMLALLLMNVATKFGLDVGGLFSDDFIDAPWSWARVVDLLQHIWVPVIVLAVGGTAGLIRTMRANLLDQLEMPYVETARAGGLSETKLLLKYPVRVAINPIASTIGWMLPSLFSGSIIVAMVLSLQTTGPLLWRALMDQDMHLAGAMIMILSTLTVIGTLISDIALAWVDPRIRFESHTT